MIKTTKDPKLAGRKGMTFLSMENIFAVNATGSENCEVEKAVSTCILGDSLVGQLTIITTDSHLLS
jgi:hypothetical protein